MKTKPKKRNKSLSGPEGMGTGAKLLLLALPVAGLVYYAMNRPGKAGGDPALPPAAVPGNVAEMGVEVSAGIRSILEGTKSFLIAAPEVKITHPGGGGNAAVTPVSTTLFLVLDDGTTKHLAHSAHNAPATIAAPLKAVPAKGFGVKTELSKVWAAIKENRAALKERPARDYTFSVVIAYSVKQDGAQKDYTKRSPRMTIKLPKELPF